jgi:hypothetical protein
MTFVPSTAVTTGAVTAGAAAAQHQRMLQGEEELMTKYSADEIEGWEFKIVRAATRKFKDPEFFRQTCEEEARSGWEMVEKFDNSRIRFKRKTENRDRDQHRDIDPYRTQVGMTTDQLGLLITVAVFLVIGALLGTVFLLTNLAK